MCVLKVRTVTASGENIRERAAPTGAFLLTPTKSESCESPFFFLQILTGFPMESAKIQP